MPRLTISLLGNFTVSLDDAPVDGFAYDKVRALLAYLAVENDHTNHREHVADLLWPGYPTRSARQNLSQALSTLRGALGDRDNDPPFLFVDHREIQFNRASDTWLDVSELKEHLDAVQTHAHANLAECAVCRGHLEQATALYRGDFLDDLQLSDSAPFEEWSLLQRENLRRQVLDALEHLTESYLQRGEADAALHHARRQLALDAWREPAHRQVMRALVLSGQRNAAITHYEECRRLLAAGLGVEPETATLELAAALKSRTLSGSTQVFAEDARAGQVMIGKPVGNYLVVAYLGQGGMAQVYKAYHTRLARYVALKFIRPELLQADALRAFEQEAKTLARLNHPNVVQVYDFGELDGIARQPYLVMEFVAGETLKEWLPEDQPLPLEQVWPILQQISAALDHAHEQGIIHRDIKPGNVMLTPDGHALLGDFGISKLLRPGEEAAYTVASTGTPAYMAPEQVDLDLGPISPATDVYALGIVAYEMLTGKHPFQGVTPITEMLQRIQSPPTPPRQYNPALPEAVERVLLTALSKEPDARYPRAGAFMRALAAAAPELIAKVEGQPAAHVPAWWPQLTAEPAPEPGDPPFMGLQHFDVADADLFFGREALTTRLLRQLFLAQSPVERPTPEHLRDVEIKRGAHSRFLAIVGASGSGKSSLVRAGLVAAVRRGETLAGSKDWPVHVLTPTAHPLENLALALTQGNESVTAATTLMDDMARDPRSLYLFLKKQDARSKKQETGSKNPASSTPQPATHKPQLLVIDQFEEVFTLCHNADERQAFIGNLLTAAGISRGGDGERDGKVFVLLTLRADFYDHCAQYPDLREALGRHQVYIGPLTPDGLRRAIEEPATRHQWAFEPGLVDLMLRDIGADGLQPPEPGALPLLSHALLETWKRRRGRTLTLGGYAEAGGVRGAIAKTADAVYATLMPAQQTLARTLFLRLTELGEGTQDTRRRVAHSEILSDAQTAPAVEAVLDILANARLITLEQDVVQVAHEALIREWPTLREWLEEDREGLRVYRHLTESALEWERLGRDPGDLYRGARLAQASEWAAAHPEAVNPLERAYLSASQADAQRIEREREAQRQRELEAARKLAEAEKARAEEGQAAARKLRLRARSLAVAAVGIFLVAVIAVLLWNQARLTSRENATLADDNANIAATAVAVSVMEAEQRAAAETARSAEETARIEADAQRSEAETARDEAESARDEAQQQARRARSSQLAAQAPTLLDEELDLALLLGAQAYNTYDSPQSRGSLLEVLDYYPGLIRILHGHGTDVHSVAFSPDGQTLASASMDGKLQLWSVNNEWQPEKVIYPVWDHIQVNSNIIPRIHDIIAFSPDGNTLVIGDWVSATLTLWDMATGEALYSLNGHEGGIWAVRFSPDGKLLASGSRDGTLILWDMESGSPLTPPLALYKAGVTVLDFSPDGKTLVTAGCLDTQAHTFDCCYQGEVHFWNVEQLLHTNENLKLTGQTMLSQTIPGPAAGVWAIAFSPDGTLLAMSGCKDRRADGWCSGQARAITLWNMETNEFAGEILINNEVQDTDKSIIFTPDGRMMISHGGTGNIITIWDVQTLQPIKSIPAFDNVKTLALDSMGTHLALGTEQGKVYLWDLAAIINSHRNGKGGSGSYFVTYHQTPNFSMFTNVAFSPDGAILAGSIFDGNVGLWDAATGKPLRDPLTSTMHVAYGHVMWEVEFSPDGSILAAASFEGTIHLWDTTTWQLIHEPLTGHTSSVCYLEWNQDGKTLFSSSYDGTIRRWDVATGQPIGEPLTGHTDQVIGIALSPDGKYLASGSLDTTVRLWDATTGEPVGEPLTGHTAGATDVAFSSDGRMLASGSHDATIRLWDVSTRQPIGGPLTGHQMRIWAVAFSPDDTTLVSVDLDGILRFWDVATQRPIGPPIKAHDVAAIDATFSPDGTVLATGGVEIGGEGRIYFWDWQPASWKTRVCAIVGRNLTQDEWARYLPDVPYEKTCPQWPAGE